MLERIDIDNLDDLTETLRELKLGTEYAPLVFTLELLIDKMKSGGSPAGLAQVAAQINAIMKELLATKEPASSGSTVLAKYKK